VFCSSLLIAALTSVPPQPTRYHMEIVQLSDLDRTGVGGDYLHGVVTTRAIVSLTTHDSAGGMAVRIVIDSISVEPVGAATMVLAPAMAAEARHAVIDALVVNGRITGTPHLSASLVVLNPVRDALELLFTGTRTGLAAGSHWSDTTSLTMAAAERTGVRISNWRAGPAGTSGLILDESRITEYTTHAKVLDETQQLNEHGTSRVVLNPARLADSAETSETGELTYRSGDAVVPGKTGLTVHITRIP
jgi:hypothetical protein